MLSRREYSVAYSDGLQGGPKVGVVASSCAFSLMPHLMSVNPNIQPQCEYRMDQSMSRERFNSECTKDASSTSFSTTHGPHNCISGPQVTVPSSSRTNLASVQHLDLGKQSNLIAGPHL